MRFTRFGKTYQLCIESTDDLAGVLDLDESLWVATSAPVAAFWCDPEFLALVDADANGRINSDELKAAIRWLLERLTEEGRLSESSDTLQLSAIESSTPQGRTLVASARYVLGKLGKPASEAITLGQVRTFTANVKSRPLNGDGIIVPEAASDPNVRGFIEDVAACTGGAEDASGRKGIKEEHLSAFMAAARGYLDWKSKAEIPPGQTATAVLPLGDKTPSAYDICQAHAADVNAFFALCRAVRFGPKAAEHIGWRNAVLESLDPTSLEQVQGLLKQAPLARLTAEATLPLSQDNFNPLYRQWLADFREHVLRPVLGGVPEQLSEADWNGVRSFFAPYAAYLQAKAGGEVESLPVEKLREYRDGQLEQRARELIKADKNVATMMVGVGELKRLLLYHQNLLRLANNFVSFPELYALDKRALFETGSAVIDGRWFHFSTKVDDVASHSATARTSNVFTLYLEVTGVRPDEKFLVVSPATSGSRGNLGVGKRGVFFDVVGKEYGARVVNIIENPISVREALAAPFVRLWSFIVGKIESLAGKAERGLEEAAGKGLAAPAAGAGAASAGLFVGLSVAVAALSSAFAYILKTFAALKAYQIVLGIGAAAVVVLLPVILLAILKLRTRDLSALLEGCGWAINARMRLNRAQRRRFTTRMPYPEGAEGTPRRRWLWLALILLVLAGLIIGGYYGIKALPQGKPAPEAQPGAGEGSAAGIDDAPRLHGAEEVALTR